MQASLGRFEGREAEKWDELRVSWHSLHRKLVTRRCRLVSELQGIFNIQPRTGQELASQDLLMSLLPHAHVLNFVCGQVLRSFVVEYAVPVVEAPEKGFLWHQLDHAWATGKLSNLICVHAL